MNANLGIVFRKSDREKLLSAASPRLRTWGSETVEEDGPQRFVAVGLEDVEFQLFPVTKFVRGKLPLLEQEQELEYAWMTGPALDTYEAWAKGNRDSSESHAFEVRLVALLERSHFWALMFAPEGERLGSFVTVDASRAVRELRRGASDVATSGGFLAVSS
jgi:hypothetical protein